ncbi:hypothetical protein ANCDUO_15329 [Ancylostoma duodenale]|uniref:Uncharacterized protein n=1 Tax=Ancylostoma duodenale TaxID=51022 RepID=A0A0C2G6H7_9BILA|nr:hypothetical protein ANCDUO_15329 [Ancylostoma duodenale]
MNQLKHLPVKYKSYKSYEYAKQMMHNYSKHLHRILSTDEESNTVTTNPGCRWDAGGSKAAGQAG